MANERDTANPALPPHVIDQIVGIVRETPNFYPPDEPIFGETDSDIVAPDLHSLLSDPEAVVAYTTHGQDAEEVAGFSVAIPIGRMDSTREAESADTAYIYYTAIQPSLRGRGLVGPLMQQMYAQLRERGYKYVERDAVEADGWADTVERNHRDAIITSHGHDKWGLGPERFFRMDLGKLGIEKPGAD